MEAFPLPLSAPGKHPQGGFTAIELMVTVAIVATLAALAAPSFTPLLERWRIRDSAESLTSGLYAARAEAIKRGGNVIILKYPNSGTCTNAATPTDWGCGWHMFQDVDNDGAQGACLPATTPNECDIQVSPIPVRTSITLAGSTGAISVDRWGMFSHLGGATTPTNMYFDLTPQGKTMTDPSAAKLCTASSGRIARKPGSGTC